MSMPMVDVVICVHNALEDLQACIASVERSTYPKASMRLFVVDDGSDVSTSDYVHYATDRLAWARRIRHDTAQGYTRAANAGLAAGNGEIVVFLNSDTVVPAGWLEKLMAVFAAKPDIGLVGPLSNAASWQSVPDLAAPEGGWAVNTLPEAFDVDDMDAIIQQVAVDLPVIPRVPLLNGFCLAVRRTVFEKVGEFDADGFPMGFGEEDDLCLRASIAGFGLGVAAGLYVYHAKSKSYGTARRTTLTEAGQQALMRKHGQARLQRASDTMKANPYFAQMRDAVSLALKQSD